MIIFLNGQFVPEERALISAFDRGFLYGDGLFETVMVTQGQMFRWAAHLDRLLGGADRLKLRLSVTPDELGHFANELIWRNRAVDATLRINVSRGSGRRGYSIDPESNPTVLVTLHPATAIDPAHPPCWNLVTSTLQLSSNDPLGEFKTSNKLPQIFARMEAEQQGAEEALLLNDRGHAVEGASGNLFWIEDRAICTPPLTSGALAGITRSVVKEICMAHRQPVLEKDILLQDLAQAGGLFLTLSTLGIVEVLSLDNKRLSRSPLTHWIRTEYWQRVQMETSSTIEGQ